MNLAQYIVGHTATWSAFLVVIDRLIEVAQGIHLYITKSCIANWGSSNAQSLHSLLNWGVFTELTGQHILNHVANQFSFAHVGGWLECFTLGECLGQSPFYGVGGKASATLSLIHFPVAKITSYFV